jgi:hypothetical protein
MSGLNVGYWSPACKDWFQRHLAKIVSNEALLISATDWRSNLVMNKNQRRLAKANAKLAAKWLDGEVFS